MTDMLRGGTATTKAGNRPLKTETSQTETDSEFQFFNKKSGVQF
jgi:hypothetical protein